MIRLRVLGPIELHDAQGRELTSILAQPKRLALLVYLAVANGFQRRDALLALLWPELDDTRARAALNQAVRFLRKELAATADSVLISRGAEELGLVRTHIWCDAVAFRDDIAAQRYGDALESYRGDLLEGFHGSGCPGFEEWLERERVDLRGDAARAARAVAEAHECEGHFTTAVTTARRAVVLSREDERTFRDLLRLLDRLGDRAGAVHSYEAFATRLASEFDAEPAAETKALIESIRSRETPAILDRRPSSASAVAATASDLPPGSFLRQIDQWRLEREIGRGGSAIVFLARDIKHNRHVAFKTLKPEIAVATGSDLFLREIQLTAQLAHPHILPLIDSGARDGIPYFISPFVPGESLRERLARERRLPLGEALRIASEMAEALDYAHRRGIVHCDIKPENVLLVDGHAVIADFGVAQALAASISGSAKTEGVMGTRVYMSPEQRDAGGVIGIKSDTYSFGCVIYEMLMGATPHGVLSATELRRSRPDLPTAVRDLIRRCLAVQPDERPDDAELLGVLASARSPLGLRRAWRRLAAAGGLVAAIASVGWYLRPDAMRAVPLSPGRVIIADFAVVGIDTSLGGVLAELTRTALAQSPTLSVVTPADIDAALQAMRQNDKNGVDLAIAREIAQREGLDAVLYGSVHAVGSRLLFILQVVNPDSGNVTAEFRRNVASVEDLVGAVDGVVRDLRSEAGESLAAVRSTRRLERVTTHSLAAFKNHVQGLRAVMNADFEYAAARYRDAVAIDSGFAMAWRRLAAVMGNLRNFAARDSAIVTAYRLRHRVSEYERFQIEGYYFSTVGFSRQKAGVAYEMSGRLYGDHGNLGAIWRSRRQFAAVESLLTESARKRPDEVLPHLNLVGILANQGKLRKADTVIDRAIQRFPRSANIARLQQAQLLYLSGNHDGYFVTLDNLQQVPDPVVSRGARALLASLALMRGRVADYYRLTIDDRRNRQRVPATAYDYVVRALIEIAIHKDNNAGLAFVDSGLARVPRTATFSASAPLPGIARAYALAGRPDRARQALQRYAEISAAAGAEEQDTPIFESVAGYLALSENRPLEAVTRFRNADMAVDGPAHDCTMCALRELGFAFESAGYRDSAISMYERFLETPYYQRMVLPPTVRSNVIMNVDPFTLADVYQRLARLLEEEGDTVRAVHYYERFVRLWQHADTPLQPRVERARRRLRSLNRAIASRPPLAHREH